MKKQTTVNNRVKKQYNSVDEFRAHLESVTRKKSRLTLEVDRLLASNSYTLAEIMSKIDSLKKSTFTESNDFANVNVLKKHIKYRAQHNCFKYALDQYANVLLKSIESESQDIDF